MFSNIDISTLIIRLLVLSVAVYFIFVFYKINYSILHDETKKNGELSYKKIYRIFLIPALISLIFTVYYFYFPIIDQDTGRTLSRSGNNDTSALEFLTFSFLAGLVGSIKGYNDGLLFYKKQNWRKIVLIELSIALRGNDSGKVKSIIEKALVIFLKFGLQVGI